ncbi:MAG: terminase [Firmicutes bacterium]|nr:terminase [Bacillota bacterium]
MNLSKGRRKYQVLSKEHPARVYAEAVTKKKVSAPKYVIKQCRKFLKIANNRDKSYRLNEDKVELIDAFLELMIMPKGLKAGQSIKECLAGFQWLFIIAVLCTVYKDNPNKRRYETAILEICRKNGKTFLIGVLFILLLFTEPRFSRFYSVAPDGALSREVQTAIREIINCSPHLTDKFKIRRDDILCKPLESQFFPLNYSNSRLDGKLPNVFLADEVGALPNNYAVEAMRSGQLTILNKLGCIISTKYPTIDNPFEDEVQAAKNALDDIEGSDETIFSLLYEPDDKKRWMTNDKILQHGNPLALEVPEIMEDLLKKRAAAIAQPRKRENFVTKHCNIIYSGMGTETYIPVDRLQECRVDNIDWKGRHVWIGVDLSITTDNCSVAMVAEEDGEILAQVMIFYPEGRADEKYLEEGVNYREFEEAGYCMGCGDQTVDYKVIEDYVLELEEQYGVWIAGIAYDRYNAMSSAQKWEAAGYDTVIVRQHSDTLHPPTKLLKECVLNKNFQYIENPLLEINFQNARCTEDTNKNMYVNKKKSNGKVDGVVSLINAVYLLQQDVILDPADDWGAQSL